jgi:hypothetical protein
MRYHIVTTILALVLHAPSTIATHLPRTTETTNLTDDTNAKKTSQYDIAIYSSKTENPTKKQTKISESATVLEKEKGIALPIDSQLKNIEVGIEYLKGKSNDTNWLNPVLNLVSVLVGAFLGGLLSYLLQKQQKKFETSKSLVDWKVTQLQELYGPLNALLHQSNTLYRLMNGVLLNADPKKFRLRDDEDNADFDKKLFEIYENDSWNIFRTVVHIDEVYGRRFGIECYFDEIIANGERMVAVIEKSAGYVREDQPILASVFGKYLAHFKILRKLHFETKTRLEARNTKQQEESHSHMVIDKSAAFPLEIQGLVQDGYNNLIHDLNRWGERGGMIKS